MSIASYDTPLAQAEAINLSVFRTMQFHLG